MKNEHIKKIEKLKLKYESPVPNYNVYLVSENDGISEYKLLFNSVNKTTLQNLINSVDSKVFIAYKQNFKVSISEELYNNKQNKIYERFINTLIKNYNINNTKLLNNYINSLNKYIDNRTDYIKLMESLLLLMKDDTILTFLRLKEE